MAKLIEQTVLDLSKRGFKVWIEKKSTLGNRGYQACGYSDDPILNRVQPRGYSQAVQRHRRRKIPLVR